MSVYCKDVRLFYLTVLQMFGTLGIQIFTIMIMLCRLRPSPVSLEASIAKQVLLEGRQLGLSSLVSHK